ncbi:MAG: hypothetical protein JO362_02655 [Streptomycetaceae bacterium]|nr:hypothetical protein [Streptomycetaceae bacterium]
MFLPEHRFWQSLAGAAGVLAVLTGITVGISQLHLSRGVNDSQLRTLGLTAAPDQQSQSSQGNVVQPPVGGGPDGGSPQPASSQPPRSNAAPPPLAASSPPTTSLAPPAASTTQHYTIGQTNNAPPANTPPAPPTPSLSVRKDVYTGGNGSWAEDMVALTSNVPLSGLKITVRVAQTGGVASTGTWTSLSGKVNISVVADSSAVNYLLTLNPGVTLPPGTYALEAQYNHATGSRDTQNDLYTITATTAGSGTSQSANGHF